MHESKCYGELETGSATLALASDSLARTTIGEFEENNRSKRPAGFEIAFIIDNVQYAYEYAVPVGAQALQPPTKTMRTTRCLCP
ncbi:hypothetical protein H0W26_05455 [Candidatus Dependentiae bacterium]|nr:hypothetical protein [Candidatus Dependentiae bacterium]